MNLQERVERYIQRGLQKSDAEILVLIEECASGLFSAFPERFILVGGATLVLFYESPRLSRDLDLLARSDDLPSLEEMQKVVEASIQSLAETFGLGKLEFQHSQTTGSFPKIWVLSNQKALFSIDLTRIGGTVLQSEIVREKIAGDGEKTIDAPSLNHLLLQKCETFVERRSIKARDAFDIDHLLSKGAGLDNHLKAHLEDFLLMAEMDEDFIRTRINQVDAKLCTADLRVILPPDVFAALARDDFRQLRRSLESAFADWLEGA
jgi:hypothetical protein